MGEPGITLIRSLPSTLVTPTPELRDMWNDVIKLQNLWITVEDPCVDEQCIICRHQSSEELEQVHDTSHSSSIDHDEEVEDEGEKNEYKGIKKNRRKDRKNAKNDENAGTNRKSQKRNHDVQSDSKNRNPSKRLKTNKSRRTKNDHRRPDEERDWMTSRPYDKSIPYSHRYGYTFANMTSNDWIERWKPIRKSVEK